MHAALMQSALWQEDFPYIIVIGPKLCCWLWCVKLNVKIIILFLVCIHSWFLLLWSLLLHWLLLLLRSRRCRGSWRRTGWLWKHACDTLLLQPKSVSISSKGPSAASITCQLSLVLIII